MKITHIKALFTAQTIWNTKTNNCFPYPLSLYFSKSKSLSIHTGSIIAIIWRESDRLTNARLLLLPSGESCAFLGRNRVDERCIVFNLWNVCIKIADNDVLSSYKWNQNREILSKKFWENEWWWWNENMKYLDEWYRYDAPDSSKLNFEYQWRFLISNFKTISII